MAKAHDPTAKVERTQGARWPVRRVISMVLIISGTLWLIAGLVIRALIAVIARQSG
jgi:hypothetical protein